VKNCGMWPIGFVVEDPNFMIAVGVLAAAVGLLGLLILLLEVKFKDQKR